MVRPRRYSSIRLLFVLGGLATPACVPLKPMPPIPDLSAMQTYPTTATLGGLLWCDSVVTEKPEVLRPGPLNYPRRARKSGLQGWAVFDAIIGLDGRPEPGSLRLVAASDQVFAPAAERTISGTEFKPGRVAGIAVRTLVRVPVKFQLR